MKKKNEQDVKITVVIPAYNARWCVGRAIQSILDCDVDDIDLTVTVVDDNSNDRTFDMLQEDFEGNGEVIKIIQSPRGRCLGPAGARNLGAANSNGDLIAFLDADDVYLPNRFRGIAEVFSSDPAIAAIHQVGAVASVSQAGAQNNAPSAGDQGPALTTIGLTAESGSSLLVKLVRGMCWQMNAVTIRRSVFMALGGFNEKILMGEDLELWIRLALRYRVAPIGHQEPVCIYYRHGGNRSAAGRYEEMIDVFASALSRKASRQVDPELFRHARHQALGWVHDVVQDLIGRREFIRARSLIRRFVFAMGLSALNRLLLTDYLSACVGTTRGRAVNHHPDL